MDAIQPIQPGPVGGATRPPAAAGVSPTVAGPAFASPFGATEGTGGIASEVRAFLSEMGGGVQNNEGLQMLITLMIFLALLQAAQGGGSSASGDTFELLESLAQEGALGQGAGALHFEQTTISVTTTSIAAAFSSSSSAAGNSIDVQA